jgi:hypothetical protein
MTNGSDKVSGLRGRDSDVNLRAQRIFICRQLACLIALDKYIPLLRRGTPVGYEYMEKTPKTALFLAQITCTVAIRKTEELAALTLQIPWGVRDRLGPVSASSSLASKQAFRVVIVQARPVPAAMPAPPNRVEHLDPK